MGRWRRLGIGLMVGALAAAGIARMWPHERLLMQVAHPVIGIDPDSQQTCWLSSHQLLIVTTSNSGYTKGNWQGEAEIYDMASHTRNRLTSLTNLLLRTTVDPMGAVGRFEMSPDGTWLRWEAYFGHGAARPSLRVAHLDGTGYRAWDNEYGEKFFLDSSHLVQTRGYGANIMVVSDIQDPRKDRKYRTLAQAQNAITRYKEQQPVWIMVQRHGVELSDSYAEIETYRTQDRIRAAPDDDRNVQKSPEPLRKHRMAFPTGAAIKEAEVSPQQQFIVYDLQITQQNPLFSWLHRLLPNFAAETTLREGFWVSRADGGGMREIGHVSLPWSAHDSFESIFEDVSWLPDGKQISFVYHSMLYVVPAEPEK